MPGRLRGQTRLYAQQRWVRAQWFAAVALGVVLLSASVGAAMLGLDVLLSPVG